MAPIRTGSPQQPVAISPTKAGGGEKPLNPTALALARGLDWHQNYSSPATVKEYHAAFLAALGSDSLRADFSRALAQDFPAAAQAVAGAGTPAASGGWVPGGKDARSAADLPTSVAANWLAEMLIRQSTKAPIEDVQKSYVAFRGALATEALKTGMDRYLLRTNGSLARELGVS